MSAPTVSVSGEGSAQGPPDLATLTGTVHAAGAGADEVRQALGLASQQVSAVLAPYAASLAGAHTAELHVGPVFHPRNPGRITGYAGRLSTQLEVRDLDALPDLVAALTSLPQGEVDGPRWSLRPGHPLHREARQAAVGDAVRRAQDYAEAFGGTLGELLEISDTDSFSGGPARFAMVGGAEGAPLDLRPQQQSVSARVSLRFALVDVGLPGRVSDR